MGWSWSVLSDGGEAAVDHQRGAGDVRGVGGCQEGDGGGDFGGGAGAAQRSRIDQALGDGRILRCRQWSFDQAGMNTVATDPGLGEAGGGVAGDHGDGAFGGLVRRHPGRADQSPDRGGVHDGAAAGFGHCRYYAADTEEDTGLVDGDDPVVVLEGDVDDVVVGPHQAGVVDQYVDATVLGQDGGNDLAPGCLIADIVPHKADLAGHVV